MPFEQLTTRSFTLLSARANGAIASGIHGISNAREWIPIGKTDNIQAPPLQDLQPGNSALLKTLPTEFVFELCVAVERRARQDRLILEYELMCNRQLVETEMGGTI